MREWAEFTIEQLGKVITGQTPSKDNPEEWGDAYNFITPSDYGAYNKLALSSIRKLSDTGYFKHKSRLIPANSLLVTCIGSDMGKVVKNVHPSFTNQQINSFIPNENLVNSDFIYYFFKSSESYLKNLGSDGSAVPILNKSTFQQIVIELPPFLEQQAIASVLSALDDKIDLLQRQNQTLEQMAATLFRQWFIEEAKEDWESTTFVDHVIAIKGLSYKGSGLTDYGNGIPMFNLNSILEGGGFKEVGTKYYNGDYKDRHLVTAGDLIVANTEQGHEHKLIGYAAIIPSYFKGISIFTHHVFKVNIKSESYISIPFFYYLLSSRDVREQVIAATNGSTVNQLSSDGLERPTFKLPPKELIDNFTNLIFDFWRKKDLNNQQIQTLQATRDTLLPKLISGEVRLKGFENESCA